MRSGTLDETAAFINTVRTGAAATPTPADVLQAVELCHAASATDTIAQIEFP